VRALCLRRCVRGGQGGRIDILGFAMKSSTRRMKESQVTLLRRGGVGERGEERGAPGLDVRLVDESLEGLGSVRFRGRRGGGDLVERVETEFLLLGEVEPLVGQRLVEIQQELRPVGGSVGEDRLIVEDLRAAKMSAGRRGRGGGGTLRMKFVYLSMSMAVPRSFS
jgi:hypothetical protein